MVRWCVILWWRSGIVNDAYEIVRTGLSIAEFLRVSPDDDAVERCVVLKRWADGLVCAYCESADVTVVGSHKPMPYRRRSCRKHFSVKSLTLTTPDEFLKTRVVTNACYNGFCGSSSGDGSVNFAPPSWWWLFL